MSSYEQFDLFSSINKNIPEKNYDLTKMNLIINKDRALIDIYYYGKKIDTLYLTSLSAQEAIDAFLNWLKL